MESLLDRSRRQQYLFSGANHLVRTVSILFMNSRSMLIIFSSIGATLLYSILERITLILSPFSEHRNLIPFRLYVAIYIYGLLYKVWMVISSMYTIMLSVSCLNRTMFRLQNEWLKIYHLERIIQLLCFLSHGTDVRVRKVILWLSVQVSCSEFNDGFTILIQQIVALAKSRFSKL